MSTNIEDLSAIRSTWEATSLSLDDQRRNLEAACNRALSVVIQLLLLEIAASDPSITEFWFDASYEYDDESSYYWSVSFRSNGDNADADPWERFEEVEQYAGEAATQIAFNSLSSLEGRITVAALQEAVRQAGVTP